MAMSESKHLTHRAERDEVDKNGTKQRRSRASKAFLHTNDTAILAILAGMYLKESVEGRQDDRHGQVVRIYEVEGLRHGYEHFVIHSLRHSLFLHPFRYSQVIALFNVLLTKENGWDEPDTELDLLRAVAREQQDRM